MGKYYIEALQVLLVNTALQTYNFHIINVATLPPQFL